MKNPEPNRRNSWLRDTLAYSRKDAAGNSMMTGICDNFMGAFAVFLQATLAQIGWLTALPQLVGACAQMLSVWICPRFSRRRVIVAGATVQAVAVLGISILAFSNPLAGATWLIGLAVLYSSASNFVQPQWRSWMGSLVPARRRGAFFAGRTRLSMIISFVMFFGGGMLLNLFQVGDLAWLGFGILFVLAATGRGASAHFLRQMHDPDHRDKPDATISLGMTLGRIAEAFRNKAFREYSLFFAGMHTTVAISAPFFSVYMLRDLEYTYAQFTMNTAVAILTQFFTLSTWGKICDRYGNRLVMVISSCLIPIVPALWLFSDNFYYLLSTQLISGLAWGGFALSTANFLYDLRPPRADFASYAAVQSALGALGIFCGALFGGYLASNLPYLLSFLPEGWAPTHSVIIIFGISALLRAGMAAWFIPRSVELRVRHHPSVLQVVYRISRFTSGAGIVLDWLTVTKKRNDDSNS